MSEFKIPDNITFDQAATIPLGIATSMMGLYGDRPSQQAPHFTPPWEQGGLGAYKGEPIVIFGGSTCVGQFGE